MPHAASLTDSAIRRHAIPTSFRRGAAYFEEGRVADLELRGAVLCARVDGSTPYDVRVRFEGAVPVQARCTCPYIRGGWCKHVVATLLAFRQQNARQLPSLEESLRDASAADLRALLQALLERHPNLAAEVEAHLLSR